jgi:hypothetical protein
MECGVISIISVPHRFASVSLLDAEFPGICY